MIAETGKEELKEIGYEDPTDEQGTAFINNSINFVYADKGERSPAWDVNIVSESSKDLFGIRTLDFRFDVSNGEEPDFLTADITDYIECRPFLASEYDEKPYMPGQRYDDKLDDYCFATPGIYLIPLYLLVGSGSKDDKLRKKRLLAIIKRMRDQITESISTYHFNLDVEAKQEFAFSIIIDSLDRKKYSDASDKDEKFESLIIEKAELWEDYFQKYLYSCIEKMKLNKIEMPEGSRARAIDIYENMNMGGLSLSTLDLVAARVAIWKAGTFTKSSIIRSHTRSACRMRWRRICCVRSIILESRIWILLQMQENHPEKRWRTSAI